MERVTARCLDDEFESYLTELYERDPPARITANRLFGTGTLQLEWSTFDISKSTGCLDRTHKIREAMVKHWNSTAGCNDVGGKESP